MTQPAPVPTAPAPGDPAPTPTDPPATPPVPPAPPTPGDPADQPLGPAGKKALDAEREARKALEKQLADLAPLKDLADALGGGQKPADGKSEVEQLQERFAELERTASDERAARWRIEVAQAKNLNAEQAAWLQGATREELEASADRLLAAFPVPPGSRAPAPDPSQGSRGGQPTPGLEAQIAEAKASGDNWRAVALERSKLQNTPRPT